MTKIPHPDVIPGIAYPNKNKILEEVCNHYGIPVVALYKRTRERKISEPRMVVMALFKYALGWTNEQIGFEFRITTASVVHGRKTVRNLYLTDRTFKVCIDELLESIFFIESDRNTFKDRLLSSKQDKSKFRYWKERNTKQLV